MAHHGIGDVGGRAPRLVMRHPLPSPRIPLPSRARTRERAKSQKVAVLHESVLRSRVSEASLYTPNGGLKADRSRKKSRKWLPYDRYDLGGVPVGKPLRNEITFHQSSGVGGLGK